MDLKPLEIANIRYDFVNHYLIYILDYFEL